MATTIVAPELTFWFSIKHFFVVRELLEQSKSWSEGFIIANNPYTQVHAWFTLMGGFAVEHRGRTHRLDYREFGNPTRCGYMPRLEITEHEITGKSKSDLFEKSIACIQISRLVVQLISRAIQRLPVTPLELFALGIVVCTLSTYVVLWYKPKDIAVPLTISLVGNGIRLKSWRISEEFGRPYVPEGPEIPRCKGYSLYVYLAFVAVTVAFGTYHVIAWGFLFPTPAERLIWRVSSVCFLAFLMIFLAATTIEKRTKINPRVLY